MPDSAPTLPDTATPPAFGARIRDLRKKAGLTLQSVADQAGISVGFLSQVERDKATPSLGTLAGIAAALGVEMDVFVTAPRVADSFSPSASRERFAIADTSVGYERLSTSLPGGVLTTMILHVPEGYTSEINAHSGEEFILVLEGLVRIDLAAESRDMGPGDSVHYMGETPHRYANTGSGPARLLWTGTTPRLYGRPPARDR